MKKVYQTIVDNKSGNCMQAVIASLFELALEEVPPFIEYGERWYEVFYQFLKGRNYEFAYFNKGKNETMDFMRKLATFDGGINGYFYGVVASQTFPGGEHAVVIDKDLNIVHDPNPNQKALLLRPDDVLGFYITSHLVITEDREILTYEEYCKR